MKEQTNYENLWKMTVTLKNAAVAMESIRQFAGIKSKEFEMLIAQMQDNFAKGADVSDKTGVLNDRIQETMFKLMGVVKTAVNSVNGIGRPGVIPQGIQLSLFNDVETDHKLLESISEPQLRTVHRSGMIQLPSQDQRASLTN